MAKEMLDIGLDGDDDLDIVNGDFTSVESTQQHQKRLLLDGPGDYKENATIGVGLADYLDDEGPQELLRKIAQEFARDGMSNVVAEVRPDGTLRADGEYR